MEIIHKNKDHIQRLFSEFKKTEAYKERKSQERFAGIAARIIRETLKNDKITNEQLQAFVQMFRPDSSSGTFLEKLAICISDQAIREKIYSEYTNIGEKGFTIPGLWSIKKPGHQDLESIKNFLNSVINNNSFEQIQRTVDEYEYQNIPEVKMGIFSPWLYYIKPELCPIVNNVHYPILKSLGWNGSYSRAMDIFRELKTIVGENNLGTLDMFFWEHQKEPEFLKGKEKTNKCKIYELKGEAAINNFQKLKDENKQFIFWNEEKFINNDSGDYVFIININSREAYFTILENKGITTNYLSTNDTTNFTFRDAEYSCKGKWGRFAQFRILKKESIPLGWSWTKILGKFESYDVWKEDIKNIPDRIDKVDDLLSIFKTGQANSTLIIYKDLLKSLYRIMISNI
jgi:hypothetical protein